MHFVACILCFLYLKIQQKLLPYVKVVMKVLPKKMIMPKYDYTSPGIVLMDIAAVLEKGFGMFTLSIYLV